MSKPIPSRSLEQIPGSSLVYVGDNKNGGGQVRAARLQRAQPLVLGYSHHASHGSALAATSQAFSVGRLLHAAGRFARGHDFWNVAQQRPSFSSVITRMAKASSSSPSVTRASKVNALFFSERGIMIPVAFCSA
ncbi:MAG: hypothetical protein QM784_36725 [Polyangiaceae bacterium]